MLVYYLIVNVIGFLLYGIDKLKAKADAWRIPEKTLLLIAAVGGAFGAFFCKYEIRRKFMVKQVVRDVFFLGQKSEPATKDDISIGQDLIDTLNANKDRCVGMAANMIGIKKNIIIVSMGFMPIVMFNPSIKSKEGPYDTEEGCLSLDGTRKTTRYKNIEVEFMNMSWQKQTLKLSGWEAQICQHEIDHLQGIII